MATNAALPYFDPRQVPVVGTGAHLPLIPADRLTPQALRQRFDTPPLWEPEVVRETSFSQRERANASVLLPLVMRDELMVLLTQRTLHLTTHAGQIAFPGGKADAEDADEVATALRETYEEVGLAPEFVHVIGMLPHYITGTHFVISPVVGLVEPDFQLNINAHEVSLAFEVPLAFLMNPANHNEHAFEWQGAQRRWFSMPYPAQTAADSTEDPLDHFIWGATAGMLRNFYRFLSA
jgi:8-oxo-dGTP pyrophosphatase MutT (NUDIX family)